jgi:hypothetical protein
LENSCAAAEKCDRRIDQGQVILVDGELTVQRL